MIDAASAKAFRKHTGDRLWERYRVFVTDTEYAALCRQAGKPAGRKLIVLRERQVDDIRRTVAVKFRGQWIAVVYDVESRKVVTALPRSYLKDHARFAHVARLNNVA